jgi:hypothetical protein
MDKIKLQGGFHWSDEEILYFFDTHWGVTVEKLSAMCGRSVPYVKQLLLEEQYQ